MPLTTSSAWKSVDEAMLASRTQSTGVPSVAYPMVPSPKSTSVTHSGRRVVIERAIADLLPSGAITASSIPGTVEQRPTHGVQPRRRDPVVVGQQDVRTCNLMVEADQRSPGQLNNLVP